MFGNNIDICVIINRAQYVSPPPVLTLCLHLLTLKFVRIYTDCWILSVFRGDLYVGAMLYHFGKLNEISVTADKLSNIKIFIVRCIHVHHFKYGPYAHFGY